MRRIGIQIDLVNGPTDDTVKINLLFPYPVFPARLQDLVAQVEDLEEGLERVAGVVGVEASAASAFQVPGVPNSVAARGRGAPARDGFEALLFPV
jgi:hypothetical protein